MGKDQVVMQNTTKKHEVTCGEASTPSFDPDQVPPQASAVEASAINPTFRLTRPMVLDGRGEEVVEEFEIFPPWVSAGSSATFP